MIYLHNNLHVKMTFIYSLKSLFSTLLRLCSQSWTPLCLNSSSSFSSRVALVPLRPLTTSLAHTKYSWTRSAVQPAKHTHRGREYGN